MKCPECGSEIRAGHRICGACGYMLSPEEWGKASRRESKGGKRIAGILAAVIAVACIAGGAAWFLIGRNAKPPAPEGSLVAALQPTAEPAATAQSPEPTSVFPGLSTQEPTEVATAAPGGSDVFEVQSVESGEELFTLLREMREGGYSRARISRFSVPRDVLGSVGTAFYGCTSARFASVGDVTEIEMTWSTGVRIWQAVQFGREDELGAEDRAVLERARAMVNGILRNGMTEAECIYEIHDHIVDSTEYGEDPAKQTGSAAGVFLNGLAQCSGYVDAFFLAGRLAGLQVDALTGFDAATNDTHARNLVQVNDVWYAVDLTWDDPVGGPANHYYLLVPNGALARQRSWISGQEPEGDYAQSLDENWYYWGVPRAATAGDAAQAAIEAIDAGRDAFVLLEGGVDADSVNRAVGEHYQRAVRYWQFSELADACLVKIEIV